ncbi:MAG: alanyl-tRNA editing protein, partial [Asgard group archaeon]|nr:alanyl-tRNA editing protein [Asgard group archaeon]
MIILTEELFLLDSYLKEFEAKVVKIENEGLHLYLDKTAFFPGGGGQPNDEGKIVFNNQEFLVTKVARDKNRLIYHQLDKPFEEEIGSMVNCYIDWNRRYSIMRYHTALHILCGLIWKEFGSSVTGCNFYPDRARMDFNLADFSKEKVDYIEKRVAEEVAAA